MKWISIAYETIYFRTHPIGARLTWRESFVLAKELVQLRLR